MKALLLLCTLLWAHPLWAEVAANDADMAALATAGEARGCVVTKASDPTLLADTGLSAEAVMASAKGLIAAGKATVLYDQLIILTDKCPPLNETTTEATKPDRARFITVLEVNGCKMTKDEANTLLPNAGFTPQSSGVIVEDLVKEGLAQMDDTGFTLKTGKCL